MKGVKAAAAPPYNNGPGEWIDKVVEALCTNTLSKCLHKDLADGPIANDDNWEKLYFITPDAIFRTNG